MGVILAVYLAGYKILLSRNTDFDFHVWNELPLQPCNLIVILAIPAARMKAGGMADSLKGFCFYGGIVFGMIAMIMPVAGFTQISLLSVNAVGFYGFHGLVVVLALLFAALGVYEPGYADILRVLLVLVLMGGMAHVVNLLLRLSVYPDANYFYTFGIPGNVVMDYFQKRIPVELIWMTPLLFIMAALCTGITWICNMMKRFLSSFRETLI